MKTLKNLTLFVSLAAAAMAAPAAKPYSELLREFESAATELTMHTDTLAGLLENPNVSWQTHASFLVQAREPLSEMGVMVKELWNRQNEASEAERQALRRALPALVTAIRNEEAAMRYVKEKKGQFFAPEYEQSIRTLDKDAESLRTLLGAARELTRMQERERELKDALTARNAN